MDHLDLVLRLFHLLLSNFFAILNILHLTMKVFEIQKLLKAAVEESSREHALQGACLVLALAITIFEAESLRFLVVERKSELLGDALDNLGAFLVLLRQRVESQELVLQGDLLSILVVVLLEVFHGFPFLAC